LRRCSRAARLSLPLRYRVTDGWVGGCAASPVGAAAAALVWSLPAVALVLVVVGSALYCAARSRDCSGTKRRGRRTRPASVGSAIGLPVWGLRSLILGDAIHHPICSGRPCCLLYCFGACNRMHSGKGTREDVAFCFVTAVAAGYLGGHVRKGSRSLILTCCRSERGMGVRLFVRALVKTVRDKERLGPIMHESDSI